jgi:hypothetical protein
MRRLLVLFTFLFAASAFAAPPPPAFALGDQPVNPGYVPNPAFAFNPVGPIRILRGGVGQYKVIFIGLAAATAGHKSDVQVTAVQGRTACVTNGWSGPSDLTVIVNCFDIPSGAFKDNRYTVLVTFSP